jgi:selenocysteine-specific elongation factor
MVVTVLIRLRPTATRLSGPFERLASMVMPIKSVVVGTAGHIDHGKTTLIHALTGVDCDRLSEEKRRGITIDLGFASLDAIADNHTPVRIGFVDVPGHKLFIRNMLAGAGCVNAVLFVISADEGVKPQTEEHLAICNLLGVRRGVVAVTKVDTVSPERLEAILSEIRSFLHSSFLGQCHAAIIPVSARTGDGLEDLRRELLCLAAETTLDNLDHLLRLPLDRAFVMKGFGTVVTGTLLSGSLQAGQCLALEPSGRIVRVRGMQMHGHPEEHADAGCRIALNLSGIEVSEVSRGQTLVEQGTLGAVTTIDVEATLLPGYSGLKHRSKVHFHAFTSDALATVSLYGYDAMVPGERRLMRLKLSKPVLLLPGDRFVLRQASPATTIGGGQVLDVHPLHNLRKAKCLAWLKELQDSSLEQQLLLRVERRGTAGIEERGLMAETGLTQEALLRLMGTLWGAGRLLRIPGRILITREHLESAAEGVTSRLTAGLGHAGLKRSEMKSQLNLSTEVFDFVVDELARERKLTMKGELIYVTRNNTSKSDPDAKSLSAIADAFRSAGLTTPLVAEVAAKLNLADAEMRRLMTLLLRDKILVRMGNETVYIHKDALDALRSQMGGLRGQTIDVGGFKQLTGVSRKYAIPLLEYLDREKVTSKAGDRRLVL